MCWRRPASRLSGSHAEVFYNIKFKNEPKLPADSDVPDGLVRPRGGRGPSALFDFMPCSFGAKDERQVRRIADHLALAHERRIARLVTISSIVPDQAFLSAVRSRLDFQGPDRLRSLTWMETVDIALSLLERKSVDSQVGIYLLEQYVQTLKDEVVRETQARAERDQGALYFTSLGGDWDSFVDDVAGRRRGRSQRSEAAGDRGELACAVALALALPHAHIGAR